LGVEDQDAFTAAGLPAETAAALALFRERAKFAQDPAPLGNLTSQLGDRNFARRQKAERAILSAGPLALPFLRKALTDRDKERARRARECLERIERGPGPMLMEAAARLLALRRPPGAEAALLEYAPYADDDRVEEALVLALAAVSLRDGKAAPEILEAARSSAPARRAAAAFVLGRATNPEHRRASIRLLTDPKVEVRWRAADALTRGGEKQAVPVLIALLGEAPPVAAWRAERLLHLLTGARAPQVWLQATPASRRQCRAAWEQWWKANGSKIDLQKVNFNAPAPLFLVADLDEGEVVAFGRDRKECWRVAGCRGPIDVQLLPSGRLLVTENHGECVTERDRFGRVVWQYRTEALPASALRLPNGNTFIATKKGVLEVTPDRKKVWSAAVPDGPCSARRLRNGNFAVLTRKGEMLTLDPAGKLLSRFTVQEGKMLDWESFEVLPNGHYYLGRHGDAVEFTATGEVVNEAEILTSPQSIARLPGKSTLVCDPLEKRVIEVVAEGKVVREYKLKGRPWHVQVIRDPAP
jgi:hypothetical protein